MKVLILAPNGGASLSIGGGTNFVMKQASCLASLGATVVIAGYHALDKRGLERLHGVLLPDAVQIDSAISPLPFDLFRAFPTKLSAYNVHVYPGFSKWVSKLFSRHSPDVVWFHDDVPVAALSWTRLTRCFLYVHYPFYGPRPSAKEIGGIGGGTPFAANEVLLRAVLHGRILPNPFDSCEEIWSNSTLTAQAVQLLWGSKARYVPTFVIRPPHLRESPGKTIVSLGTISPGKRYEDLITGFHRSALSEWRLLIVGHGRDYRYLTRLRTLVRELSEDSRVQVLIDTDHLQLAEILASSSVIVHSAWFEPFGLALLEGMAFGGYPIVRSSKWSGAWLDIVREGKDGLGFGDATALAEDLREVTTLSSTLLQSHRVAAFERAGSFSRENLLSALAKSL